MFWPRHRNRNAKFSKHLFLLRTPGFVLMEALIAIIILSTSLTLIIQSLGQSVRVATYSADFIPAAILLENKLSGLWGRGLVDQQEQKVSPPFDKYQHQLSSNIVPTENQGKIAFADVSLLWTSGRIEKSLSVQTYLLLPANENPEALQ